MQKFFGLSVLGILVATAASMQLHPFYLVGQIEKHLGVSVKMIFDICSGNFKILHLLKSLLY